jgi:hypothetical protein
VSEGDFFFYWINAEEIPLCWIILEFYTYEFSAINLERADSFWILPLSQGDIKVRYIESTFKKSRL